MASKVTLDAGAIIAAENNDRRFWAFWRYALQAETDFILPAAVLARVWRGATSVRVALVLKGCELVPMNEALAKRSGQLCGDTRTSDVVDASVVATAENTNSDAIITSDPGDISVLVQAAAGSLRALDLSAVLLPSG